MSGLRLSLQRRVDSFAFDVSLAAEGGVTGIIGPSGAGKSMLLQMIAGLAHPDQGKVSFDGEILSDTATRTFLAPEHRRIGYVFQDALLFPHMSVAQNLGYGAARRATGSSVSRDEVIGLLGLGTLLDRRPHHLSGGEAQRVSIGRALLSAPRLLLMDEPLSSLDPRRRADIMPFIEALHRRLDLPILYVSHNIDEITRLADRVVVLHDGHVAAAGEVASVLNQPDMQALILSDGSDNDPAAIIEATVAAHDAEHHVTLLSVGSAQISLPLLPLGVGAKARLRIHARDVAIATEPPHHISIQNIIEAEISHIAPARNGQCDITLLLGEVHMLKSRITTKAQATLGLRAGMKVWALVKSVALASGT